MIFVTVGTHEQQFNRLIQCIDKLKGLSKISEDVFMQTGYSTYEPKYCNWSKLFHYNEMRKYVANARIVITHGGPSTFIMPLQFGKIPVVVPREKQFDEHVNDHQVEFVRAVNERQGNIIPVFKIDKLEEVLEDYESIVAGMQNEMYSNNKKFNFELNRIVNSIFK